MPCLCSSIREKKMEKFYWQQQPHVQNHEFCRSGGRGHCRWQEHTQVWRPQTRIQISVPPSPGSVLLSRVLNFSKHQLSWPLAFQLSIKCRLIDYKCQACNKCLNGGHYHFNNRKLEKMNAAPSQYCSFPNILTWIHTLGPTIKPLRCCCLW